jgi:Ion channel
MDARLNRTLKSRAQRARERRERYGLLLLAILAAFSLQGIATPAPWEQVVVTILLAGTLLLALWAAEARPVVIRLAVIIDVALIGAAIVEAASGNVDGAAARLANTLLLCLAPPAVIVGISRSLKARGTVTVEAVFGVLCLYILIGMLFAGVYGSIDRLGHQFFANGGTATVSHCLYFSFITLTTVGYGDYTAGGNLGHTLSATEALIGQIYLVTVVSVIVSNLRRHPLQDRSSSPT